MKKVTLLNGPNLNLLGVREPAKYGDSSLDDILSKCQKFSGENGFDLDSFQSNSEADLINRIQLAMDDRSEGILINPGAYGHTSIGIRDAFLAVGIPFVEVHISNIFAREEFRHKTLLSDIAIGIISGFGAFSYVLGLQALFDHINKLD